MWTESEFMVICQKIGARLFCSSRSGLHGKRSERAAPGGRGAFPAQCLRKTESPCGRGGHSGYIRIRVALRLSWMFAADFRRKGTWESDSAILLLRSGQHVKYPVGAGITDVWEVVANLEQMFDAPAGIYVLVVKMTRAPMRW